MFLEESVDVSSVIIGLSSHLFTSWSLGPAFYSTIIWRGLKENSLQDVTVFCTSVRCVCCVRDPLQALDIKFEPKIFNTEGTKNSSLGMPRCTRLATDIIDASGILSYKLWWIPIFNSITDAVRSILEWLSSWWPSNKFTRNRFITSHKRTLGKSVCY